MFTFNTNCKLTNQKSYVMAKLKLEYINPIVCRLLRNKTKIVDGDPGHLP